MKTFSAANQKGGVGKTNTNCSFAHFLAKLEYSTLIVNGDEQDDTNDTMAEYELHGIQTHLLFGTEPLRLPATFGKLTLIASDREKLREIEESEVDDIDLVRNLRSRLAELAPNFEY